MNNSKFNVPRGLVIIALVCFLMPFMSLSCGGSKVMSFTGLQLTVGTQIQMSGQTQKLPSEPMVIVALVAGVAALVFLFMQISNTGLKVAAGAATAGALSLLHYQSVAQQQLAAQGGGMIQITWEAAFWIVLVCYVSVAIWGFGAWKSVVKE